VIHADSPRCPFQPPPRHMLVTAAAAILREADSRGIRMSQTALARRLRAGGMSIPNQRLRWLAAAASAEASMDVDVAISKPGA
jgi:hypothetical protein